MVLLLRDATAGPFLLSRLMVVFYYWSLLRALGFCLQEKDLQMLLQEDFVAYAHMV